MGVLYPISVHHTVFSFAQSRSAAPKFLLSMKMEPPRKKRKLAIIRSTPEISSSSANGGADVSFLENSIDGDHQAKFGYCSDVLGFAADLAIAAVS